MSTRDEILDQIESLQNLLDDGIMDEEQFSAAKDKLLKKLEELENEEAANNHNDEEDDYPRGGRSNGGGDDEVDPYDAYGDDDIAGAGAEGDEVVESYLDTHERLLATMKNTKANEQTRWGKSGQIYDENKLQWGSYLDTHEKDSSSRKETKFRSGAQWGKSADVVYDETKLTFGSYLKSEEEKKKQIAEEEAKKKMETIDAIKKKKDGEFLDPRNAKFKLEELQGKFPKGVDPTKKELYLSSEDFKKHFGLTLAEYVKLGAFQKKKLKKQLDLF